MFGGMERKQNRPPCGKGSWVLNTALKMDSPNEFQLEWGNRREGQSLREEQENERENHGSWGHSHFGGLIELRWTVCHGKKKALVLEIHSSISLALIGDTHRMQTPKTGTILIFLPSPISTTVPSNTTCLICMQNEWHYYISTPSCGFLFDIYLNS